MDQLATGSPFHSAVTRVGQRIATVGLPAAFLLLALTGVLPERLQIVFATSCIAFALVCVAGLVWAGDARLRWRGMSPVVALALGVIAGGLPGFLTYRASRTEDRPAARPVIANTARSVRRETPAMVAIPVAPPPSVARAAVPGAAARPPDPVLAEIATILEQRARPTLDNLYASLNAAAGYDSVDPALGSQLEPSVNALADVEASLEKIQADNPDLATELRAALGNARALTGLSSSLRQFINSLGARGSGPRQLTRLASTVQAARQWVDSADQRLASAQALEQQAGATQ